MCNITGILFGARNLSRKDVEGKRVIEIGSYDLNGSLRSLVKSWQPSEYIGVDIIEGEGVDVVCSAEEIINKFGEEGFDIVISTELLEHTRDWRKVVSNIKKICKKNGIILITTRSFGFGYHAFPYDFWRYEIEDIKNIFSDLETIKLEKDSKEPGVFIKAMKKEDFSENDLSDYELYSIVANKRVKEIDDKYFRSLHFLKMVTKERLKRLFFRFGKFTYSKV